MPEGSDGRARMLANRLRRNLARLGPWALREGLDAWRVYDRDIPEFPWAIDRFGERILATEYVTPAARRHTIRQRGEERAAVASAVAESLDVPAERIAWRLRNRAPLPGRQKLPPPL